MPTPLDRRYIGNRNPDRVGPGTVLKVDSDSATAFLDPRYDLHNHSPDGFQWGYGGSGPAQLALALCADALNDDERAKRNYQRFKSNVVARIQGNTFDLTAAAILKEVDSYEADGA